jgi:hypothetical protein
MNTTTSLQYQKCNLPALPDEYAALLAEEQKALDALDADDSDANFKRWRTAHGKVNEFLQSYRDEAARQARK